jgi:hypothetical protein
MSNESTKIAGDAPAFPCGESYTTRDLAGNLTKNEKGPLKPGMSLRQYAAIKLRVPQSGVDWLDDMIREARRLDYAGQAMQGMAASEPWAENFSESRDYADPVAAAAYTMADAMLAARTRTTEGEGK